MKTKIGFSVIIFLSLAISVLADRVITLEEMKPYLISCAKHRSSGKGIMIRTVYKKAVSQKDVTDGRAFKNDQEKEAYLRLFKIMRGVDFALEEDQLIQTIEKLQFDHEKKRRDYANLSEALANDIAGDPSRMDTIITNTVLLDGEKVLDYRKLPPSPSASEGFDRAVILRTRHMYFPRFYAFGCIEDVSYLQTLGTLGFFTIRQSESDNQIHFEIEVMDESMKLKMIYELDKNLLSYEGIYYEGLLMQERILESFARIPNGEWYPHKCTMNRYAPIRGENILIFTERFEAIPNSVDFNISIDPSNFSLEFPAGTEVADF